jgi:hypothetical protein
MSEERDEIDSIKNKLDYIEARLTENRIRLDAIKTNLIFWNMVGQEYNFERDEEDTND